MSSFLFVLAIVVLSVGLRVETAEGSHPHDYQHINCTGFCSPSDLQCNESDGHVVCESNCSITLYDCVTCVSAWEMLHYTDTGELLYQHLQSNCFRKPPRPSEKVDKCVHDDEPFQLSAPNPASVVRTVYSCQCHENMCNRKLKTSIIRETLTTQSETFPTSTESTVTPPSTAVFPLTVQVTTSLYSHIGSSSAVFLTTRAATQSTSPQPSSVYHSTATASPPVPMENTSMPLIRTAHGSSNHMQMALIIGIAVPVVTLLALALVVFMVRRLRRYERSKKAEARDHRINSICSYVADSGLGSGTSTYRTFDFQEIRLENLVKCGRYGVVRRANFKGETVAVKIFQHSERTAWATEKDFLQDPSLVHDNVVHLIGVESKDVGDTREYWLVMAYYEGGNLSDFLKTSVLTWNDMLFLSRCVVSAVTYLHSESGRHGVRKTSVAHRDIKSANVLVENAHRCVLADFGMAIRLKDDISMKDLANNGQCGTARYMAPEVLDCRMNLEDLNSFKQIDIYAMGLVLWEIANRCNHTGVRKYLLPYQDEVGMKPSMSTMRTVALLQKRRPMIPQEWRHNRGMNIIAETIEECWDEDAEARLPAHCVQQRFQEILFPMYTMRSRSTASRSSSIATLRSLKPKTSIEFSETSFPDTIELPEKAETDSGASLPNSWKDESNDTEVNRIKRERSATKSVTAFPTNQRDSGTALEETETEMNRERDRSDDHVDDDRDHVIIHMQSTTVICNTNKIAAYDI